MKRCWMLHWPIELPQTSRPLIPYLAYGEAVITLFKFPFSSIVGIFFTLSHWCKSLTDLRSKLSMFARPTSIMVFIVQKGHSKHLSLVYLHVKREILHKCHIQHLSLLIQQILHQCHFLGQNSYFSIDFS